MNHASDLYTCDNLKITSSADETETLIEVVNAMKSKDNLCWLRVSLFMIKEYQDITYLPEKCESLYRLGLKQSLLV